jgi:hypothetical protein
MRPDPQCRSGLRSFSFLRGSDVRIPPEVVLILVLMVGRLMKTYIHGVRILIYYRAFLIIYPGIREHQLEITIKLIQIQIIPISDALFDLIERYWLLDDVVVIWENLLAGKLLEDFRADTVRFWLFKLMDVVKYRFAGSLKHCMVTGGNGI